VGAGTVAGAVLGMDLADRIEVDGEGNSVSAEGGGVGGAKE